MTVYIILAVIMSLGAAVKEEESKVIFYTSYIALFLLTVLRDYYSLGGLDVFVYRKFYDSVPYISELFSYEKSRLYNNFTIGYTAFNSIIKTLGGTFVTFQFAYTIIVFALLLSIIDSLNFNYKQKCLFLFSYFCFKFLWNTWVIYRQNIANLFFWYFLIRLYKKAKVRKNKKKPKSFNIFFYFILAIIIPPLFHSSGWVNIVMIPVIFMLQKVRKSMKLVFILPILSILLFYFGSSLYSNLASAIIYIDSRYSMYGTNIKQSSNVVNFFFRFVCFIFFSIRMKYSKNQLMPLFISTMSVVLILGSINAELMTRMYEYYAIGLYGNMGLFLENFEKHSKIPALLIYSVVMLIIFVRFLFIGLGGSLLNYRFWGEVTTI